MVERIEVMGHDGPGSAWVVATNVYAKTAQGWRMVAHHASPGIAGHAADHQLLRAEQLGADIVDRLNIRPRFGARILRGLADRLSP